jgi:lysine 2,3-aminomutase
MIAHVQTVLGAVTPDVIGATERSEHPLIRGGLAVLQFPDFRLTKFDKIVHDAQLFKRAGGTAIVEMSPIGGGRDAEKLERLARATGLHIIAATGFHRISYYSDIHWIHTYDEDEIAQLVCDELLVGMDLRNYSGPRVVRTSAKAGAIKIGTPRAQFNDTERKLLRVAARAHLKTGAPIIAHTDEGAFALEQIDYLTRHGVPPSRIAVCHLDRNPDPALHKEVASTGAFLEYDATARIKERLNVTTRHLIVDMVDAGLGSHILVGGDMPRQRYWKGYGGQPGLDFPAGEFRLSLMQAGLSPTEVDEIYVQNLRSFLAWSPAQEPKSSNHCCTESGTIDTPKSQAAVASHVTVRSVDQLVESALLQTADRELIEEVVGAFPLSLTGELAKQIDLTQTNDPIKKQFVPAAAELDIDKHEMYDPIGDDIYEPIKGITHRYPDRVLLRPTHICPVYCRFCFRREKVGRASGQLNKVQLNAALSYIEKHQEIWEVILSGGDPLSLSDRRLGDIFGSLHGIPHVAVVRIHTRYPIARPARVTNELVRQVKGRAAVYVVLHCNHERELTQESLTACAKLIDNGIPVLSQTVLLRGVNDNAETLTRLMRALVRSRIKPYYLHHLDPARGIGHFRTSLASGQELVRSLRGKVSGLCQPTYVLDIPGGFGKVPVGPNFIGPQMAAGEYQVQDYHGVQHSYIDHAALGSAHDQTVPLG